MTKEDVLGDVLKADDLISSALSGIESLFCLVQEIQGDCEVKRIIEENDLFGKVKSFQKLLSNDEIKKDKDQKITLIETFAAFLEAILIRMNSLPDEEISIQQFVLFRELFPEKYDDLNLAFNVVFSTLVLVIFNLRKASKMTEEDIQIEVKFQKKEKTD